MNFSKSMDLELRRYILFAYNLIALWVAKIKIIKVSMGKISLGHKIQRLFNKILHFNIPDPIEVQGMALYHRAYDGRGWLGWCYAFDYEPQTRFMLEQAVKPGMTVIDAGANIGYYTLLLAKLVGNQGKVFAFEPDPSYYTLLKKNIEVNKLGAIAEPFRIAIGDREKKSILFLGSSTGTSLFKIPGIRDQTATVDTLSLDKFFAERDWPSIDVIKIDIEGAERIALEGMPNLVQRNQELKLIIELNPSFLRIAGTTPEELLISLNELGFSQIRALSNEMRLFKIPQDIQYLADLADELSYINLFCERYLRFI